MTNKIYLVQFGNAKPEFIDEGYLQLMLEDTSTQYNFKILDTLSAAEAIEYNKTRTNNAKSKSTT